MQKLLYSVGIIITLLSCVSTQDKLSNLDGHWHVWTERELVIFFNSAPSSYFSIDIQDSTVTWFSNKPGFERRGKIDYDRKEILGVLYGDNDTIQFDVKRDTLFLYSRNGKQIGLRATKDAMDQELDFFATSKIHLNLPTTAATDSMVNYRSVAGKRTVYWGKEKTKLKNQSDDFQIWVLHNRRVTESFEFIDKYIERTLCKDKVLVFNIEQSIPLSQLFKFLLKIRGMDCPLEKIFIGSKEVISNKEIQFWYNELTLEAMLENYHTTYAQWQEKFKNANITEKDFYFTFEASLQDYVSNDYKLPMPRNYVVIEEVPDY